MEKDFQSSFATGDSSARLVPLISGDNPHESAFNSVFTEGSLQSLIPFPSDFVIPNSSLDFPVIHKSSFPASFSFFSEDFTALSQKYHLGDNSTNPDPQLGSVNFNPENLKFKIPKEEPFIGEKYAAESTQPFDFFSKPTDLCDSAFNHLPNLHSLEQSQIQPPESSSLKRPRLDSSVTYSQTLDSIVQSFYFPNHILPPKTSPDVGSPPPVIPHSELARQRRQKISDKTRCLQKLMPWNKKMDTATMLGEAYKYVQFLRAQISTLQSMPLDSSFTVTPQNDGDRDRLSGGLGSLGRLNRQQLLQVLVNSPVAQTMLYSQGFCVISLEQLILLKKIAERRAVLQQFLFHPSSTS